MTVLCSLSPLDDLGNSGSLLPNGNVDAVQLLLLFTGIIEALLVDDGVDCNRSLPGLTITDDELTLTTTDGHLEFYTEFPDYRKLTSTPVSRQPSLP